MKNVASLALAVAALAVAVYAVTQTTELGRELRNVKATLAARPASDTLDVQAKCARQATEAYRRLGLDQHPDAYFTNHYHAALGKCFIHTTDTTMTGPITTRWMNVTDAFEMREYAQYMKQLSVPRELGTPHFFCEVTLPTGEVKTCQSDIEFESLIKVYMER